VSGKSIKEAEVAVNADLNNIREWLLSNRLSLNLVKTEYLLIGSRHNINMLEEQPSVFIGDEPIKGVQVTKTLGVKIDQFLTWAFLEESIDENWNSWKDLFFAAVDVCIPKTKGKKDKMRRGLIKS
jgi:hypothetical protein